MDRTLDARTAAMAGMLSAVASLLGFFKIPITSFIELRFSSLPVAVAGYLFGPWIGGIVGALSDIGQYLIKPTGPFFPGFTISSCLTGMIFGWAFHVALRPRGRILAAMSSLTGRILLAELLVALLLGICLNSLWLSILYEKSFGTALSLARAAKEIFMIPINTLLLRAVIRPIASLPAEKGN